MLAFIIRRLLQAILVMLTVAFVAFLLFQYVGDPVNQMLGQDATPEDRARLRADLGLDKPFYYQFGHFIGNVVQGDFGLSLRQGRSVSSLIKERLPATLELSFIAALIALVAGIPMGVYTALRRNSWFAQFLLAVSLVGISLPTFLIGILLILVFAVQLGWLPSYGRGEVVQLGWWSTGLLTGAGWKHLILPSIALALFQLTLIMRLVRSEMLEVLRTDYIKFARARGLTDRAVHFGHALKNTLVPVITITGLQLGGIIAFAIVTETVFQWPGMGLLFIQSVQFADIPVMAAYLCLIALRVRRHQPHRRPALLRGRPSPADRPRGGGALMETYLGAALRGPLAAILPHHEGLTEFRRDLHANPEIGFEEHRTAALVAERLKSFGVEVHTGIGKTGVVGVIRGKGERTARSIGLRADMDALPMIEENEFAHRSTRPELMHGCGHDGHVTILLAAARYLAETRDFDGTAYVDLPAGRRGFRRGEGDDRGRPVQRRFPRRRGLRAAQLARTAGGQDRPERADR